MKSQRNVDTDGNSRDVVTQIPTCIHITEAKLHDVKAMEHLKYEIVSGDDLLDGDDNVLLDLTIRLKGPLTKKKYPSELRRIVYYAPELKRTFTFLTNDILPRGHCRARLPTWKNDIQCPPSAEQSTDRQDSYQRPFQRL